MKKRIYYVSIGYSGPLRPTPGSRKYGCGIRGRANNVIPVYCAETEIEDIAYAVGKGVLADSITVSLTEEDAWDSYTQPYMVVIDCM